MLKSQKEIDKGLRIGFELQDIEALEKLLTDDKIEVIRYPEETEWGKRCVIKDIEGRKIELTIEK